MKNWSPIAVFFMVLMASFTPQCAQGGGLDAATVNEQFAEAGSFFDAGDFQRATDAYQQLIASGVRSTEVAYNLGNARYRTGDVGGAVLAWRRAWRQAPRDPDIRANLQFVMSENEAVMPTLSAPALLQESLAESTWATITVSAWWALWGLVAAAAAFPRARPALQKVAPPLVIIVLIGAAALYHWTIGYGHREWVVTNEGGTQALYAPLEDAEPHFDLPAGSIVELRERATPWLKVNIDGREGWILDTVATAVTGIDGS